MSYSSGSGASSVSFTVSALTGSALDVSLPGVELIGAPALGTYLESSPSVASVYSMVTGGTSSAPVAFLLTKNWLGTNLGAFNLTLSSVTASGPAATQSFSVHGTLVGSFRQYPTTGTPATVTVTVAF